MDFSFLANLTLTAWVLEFLCGFPMCISLFSFNYEFYNLQINSFYFFFFFSTKCTHSIRKDVLMISIIIVCSALAAFYTRNFMEKFPDMKPPSLQVVICKDAFGVTI